jgi:tubulin monoglycylase TTLL3/8
VVKEWPKVYDGMKQAIIGVLLASQENIETRKGCFELYGADFMLAEDFKPWLIEINSCPCMAPSTSVTARMCAQCLEDTVKGESPI